MRNDRYILFVLSVVILLVFAGCSKAPSKDVIEKVILKQFETQYYRVVSLEIGSIEAIPAQKTKFKGSKGYIVSVPSLTLEFIKDIGEPWNYKRGYYLTFYNVLIRIEKNTNNKEEWVITNVSGIPLF